MLDELKRYQQIEPSCFAFWGLEGGRIPYKGYEVWPGSAFNAYGNDIIKAHIKNSEAEMLVTLMDLFVLTPEIYGQLPVPWVAWVPVDHEEISGDTLTSLKQVTYPVAMSHFGAQQIMATEEFEQCGMIYHAVDPEVFRPMDKYESRKKLGMDEDIYLIGMVMANKGNRKQIPQQLEAIKLWMDNHQDEKIRVYMHTDASEFLGGWNMADLTKRLGLSGKVYCADRYFASTVPAEDETMATMYNCMDVLMNVSAGEGFGIPLIEAQSCGIPVLSGDYTSMPELTQYGYTVKPSARRLTDLLGFQYVPSIEDMVYRLECVYRNANKEAGLQAREWVKQNCAPDIIGQQWVSLIRQRCIEAGIDWVDSIDDVSDADVPRLASDSDKELVSAGD